MDVGITYFPSKEMIKDSATFLLKAVMFQIKRPI